MLSAEAVRSHVDAIARDGYTIVPDAIEPALLDQLTADLERLEQLYEIAPSPQRVRG